MKMNIVKCRIIDVENIKLCIVPRFFVFLFVYIKEIQKLLVSSFQKSRSRYRKRVVITIQLGFGNTSNQRIWDRVRLSVPQTFFENFLPL